MPRRLALAAPLASTLSLTLAATVLAGGWANAVMDTPPDDPGPNQPVTLGFTLLQHGETPVDWGVAQVVATSAETGQEVIATATPDGATGHWSADVTLPVAGSWTYEVRHDLEITTIDAQPISVGDEAAASGAATSVGLSPALLTAGGFLALVGVALVSGVLLVTRSRRPDEVRA